MITVKRMLELSNCDAWQLEAPATVCWAHAPHALTCASLAIHLWRVPLNVPAQAISRYAATLSPDEHERATGYLHGQPSERFIARRGALRAILARYLGIPPGDISLAADAHGKPCLPDGALHFNLSHSGEFALIGIARQQIGVDLEYLRDDIDMHGIARRLFSPAQSACLDTVPPPARTRLFFLYWTRLEATLKALGSGFAEGCDAVLGENNSAPLCSHFISMPGYLAAVATAGHFEQAHFWTLSQDHDRLHSPGHLALE